MQTSRETQTKQKAFNKVWNYYIQQGRPYKLNLYRLVEADILFLNNKNNYVDSIMLDEQIPFIPAIYDSNFFEVRTGMPEEHNIVDSLKTSYSGTIKKLFENKNTSTIRNFEARRFQREFRKIFKEVLENLANDYSLTTPSPIAKTVAAKKFASKYKK